MAIDASEAEECGPKDRRYRFREGRPPRYAKAQGYLSPLQPELLPRTSWMTGKTATMRPLLCGLRR